MKLQDLKPIDEASYPGNLGMMEMFKFYQTATPSQKAEMKRLIALEDFSGVWELLYQVTGVKLRKV